MNPQTEIKTLLTDYNPAMRKVEIGSLFVSMGLFAVVLYKVFLSPHVQFSLLILSFFIGLILADFVSGLVHWFADTWGSVHWPVVGPSLIRSFREHHVDQDSITRHDFVETNGAAAIVVVPLLLVVLQLPAANAVLLFVISTTAWLCLFSLFTNQFHKWAHSVKNPPLILKLQKWGILLSRKHHARHHAGNFDHHYCITTGWLNELLNKTGFFRRTENMITKITGAKPREEDIKFTEIF